MTSDHRTHPDDEAALDWALRSADPRFDAWDALTEWLEGDPGRAVRYHRAAAGLAEMTEALRAAPAPLAPAAAPRPVTRRWVFGGALAAAVAGLIAYQQNGPVARPYAIATASGETREVALADGSRVALAGATRLVLDHADPRVATVERGQVLFTVRHDAAHPFRVTAGTERMVDTGTVFDVTRDTAGVFVAVAEGGVRIGEGRDAVDLVPGDQVQIRDGGTTRILSRVRPESVGAWATGQLDYVGTPLGEVASVVARALGTRIAVAPGLATRPFSGTLSLDALRRHPAALGPLTGGVMVRRADGWELRAGR